MLKNLKRHKLLCYFILILAVGVFLRTINNNWDNGYYFHPDERALVLFAIPLSIPSSWSNFISVKSSLNPHFFAYGSFPIYLLKLSSEVAKIYSPTLGEYGNIHYVGRFLAALFDTGTIILIYFVGKRLFSKRVGLISAFCYSASVLPIQLSHSYTVDPLLTFFLLLTLYFLLIILEKAQTKAAVLIGIAFGVCLSIKISALIFLPVILVTYLITVRRSKEKKRMLPLFLATTLSSISTILILQPYSFIDINEFKAQTLQQTEMSYNPFIFPYTLQYVGKIPFFYELKNIFLWGLGIPLASISFLGIIALTKRTIQKSKKINVSLIVFLLFFWLYFLFFGKAAVGFMRYMLPIYPLFAIAAGYICDKTYNIIPKKIRKKYLYRKVILLSFVLLLLVYPISFIHIYLKSNTRIQASYWINQNIPHGSVLAVEHWDDSLPVYGDKYYTHVSLPLYDPDSDAKWDNIQNLLSHAQYIIIASNRLYVPLQKLTDCTKVVSYRCYPKTAEYYKNLFSGKLGFKKIKEFSSYPTIPFTNIEINDFSADENFTSFDHPKIMIFKKD